MRKFAFAFAVLALFSSCGSAEAGCRLFGGRFSRPSCQTQQATSACAASTSVAVVRPADLAAPANPPVYSTVIRGGDCPNGQCPNARR